jgi:hypothetical protein
MVVPEPRYLTWRVLRGVIALAIAIALGTQFAISSDIPGFTGANFFSYFTVLSNVIAVIVLAVLVIKPAALHRLTGWRGASTLYMGVTLLVYVTVLLPMDTDVGVSKVWIDWVIHGIGPLFMIVDWLANPPGRFVTRATFWSWLIFPAAYLAYSLVRGPVADWYPYPFLDPREPAGYSGVAISSAIVLVVFILLGLVLRWWANREVAAPGSDIRSDVEG